MARMEEAQGGESNDGLMSFSVDVRHDRQNPSHDVHQSLVGGPKVKLRFLAG